MKRKTMIFWLVAEAVSLTGLTLLARNYTALFSSALGFPFEQAAEGLAALSRAGRWGNALAVMLWLGLGAIPLLLALRLPRGREYRLERWSLWLLTALLVFAIYGMMNPQRFCPDWLSGDAGQHRMIKICFALTVWAGIVLTLVLRLIRLFCTGTKEALLAWLRPLLFALALLFAAAASVSAVNDGLRLLDTAQSRLDWGVGLLLALSALIPDLLGIAVILRATALLEIAGDETREGVSDAAERLSRACALALGVSAAATLFSNLLQMMLSARLSNLSVHTEIPVVSLVFFAVLLLMSRLLVENRRLQDDNSLFI